MTRTALRLSAVLVALAATLTACGNVYSDGGGAGGWGGGGGGLVVVHHYGPSVIVHHYVAPVRVYTRRR